MERRLAILNEVAGLPIGAMIGSDGLSKSPRVLPRTGL